MIKVSILLLWVEWVDHAKVSCTLTNQVWWGRHYLPLFIHVFGGFPGGSVVKNPPANAGDTGLIPGSGRSPGAGNGNPFPCSCLENFHGQRGTWGCKESDTTGDIHIVMNSLKSSSVTTPDCKSILFFSLN